MQEIDLTANDVVERLLQLSETEHVSLLDSCGVGHLGSHLLMAGVRPVEVVERLDEAPGRTLEILDDKLSRDHAAIFTLSYDFGRKLQRVGSRRDEVWNEPDISVALFTSLVIHDYDTGKTFIAGHPGEAAELLTRAPIETGAEPGVTPYPQSDFAREEYLTAVEEIREHIRRGDTYQTNLTQQFRCQLPKGFNAPAVFQRLRRHHPAPFAAFIKRKDSTVVSASPERFFRIDRRGSMETSPVKGTRPRGLTAEDDLRSRLELQSSEKDRAENTMIVDLMRNDLGRICEFGSVRVERLCEIEEHPTLFHLVSTVRGKLRERLAFSEILRAVFPCGSITGAPKISTMQIIEDMEHSRRGLSMGSIGIYVPPNWDLGPIRFDAVFDLSVAIRTMVIRDDEAVFNVGGGVVIDSEPAKEFDESLLKAKALLQALGVEPPV